MRRLALAAALLVCPTALAEPPAAAASAAVALGSATPPRAAAPPAEASAEAVPEAPETGPQAPRIDDQSAELEAIREAERTTRVQEAPALESRVAEAAEALGAASPLRQRVEEALAREVMPPTDADAGRIPLIPELDHDLQRLQAEYDIPVDVNEAVVSYIRFFQSPLVRPHFVKWLGRSHRYLDRYHQILREEGLPEDTVYLAMIESGFANFARSRAKAVGPWQFIAPTGKLFGLRQDFWVDERRDPEKSARAAARYLRELKEQTGDWRLAWAGYNAGAGTVLRAQQQGYPDFWSMAAVKGRRILRAETKGYVPKLMAAAIVAKHPEAFGFTSAEVEPERWPDMVEVDIGQGTPLGAIAKAAQIPEAEILDLNPELRRACTPPGAYPLKLPREAAARFAEGWDASASRPCATFDGHVVKKGETLGGLAARYGVTSQEILDVNPGLGAQRLRPGAELLIPKGGPRPAAPAARTAAAGAPETHGRDPHVRPASMSVAVASHAGERPATWKVRRGDTLWSISRDQGVELKELCRLNGIGDARHHKLKVGAELTLRSGRG